MDERDLIFVVLTVIAIFTIAFMVWLATRMSLARASRKWLPVEGTLLDIRISIEHKSEDGSSYFPTVSYQYELAGTQFLSNRFTYGVFWFFRYDGVTGAIKNMAANSAVIVYYDPDRPTRSVLVRGPGRNDFIILLSAMIPLTISTFGITRILFSH